MSGATYLVCGVDEVGRGPLAGPVVAAAVVLGVDHGIRGLRDSKKLSAVRRSKLAVQIKDGAHAWALARAEVTEIDRLNILQASLLAMSRAVAALGMVPSEALIDGNRIPARLPCAAKAIVGGDASIDCISAASIIAKVSRDAEMVEMDRVFPGYGFAQHKGYPTAAHLSALRELGVTDIHRRSFAPVRRMLSGED